MVAQAKLEGGATEAWMSDERGLALLGEIKAHVTQLRETTSRHGEKLDDLQQEQHGTALKVEHHLGEIRSQVQACRQTIETHSEQDDHRFAGLHRALGRLGLEDDPANRTARMKRGLAITGMATGGGTTALIVYELVKWLTKAGGGG